VLGLIGKAASISRDVKLRMKLEVIADVPRTGVNDCQEKLPQK
jgi:hypothetical protein